MFDIFKAWQKSRYDADVRALINHYVNNPQKSDPEFTLKEDAILEDIIFNTLMVHRFKRRWQYPLHAIRYYYSWARRRIRKLFSREKDYTEEMKEAWYKKLAKGRLW